jgi:hypothetical protein
VEQARATPEELDRHFAGIPHEVRRQDAQRLAAIMADVTGETPALDRGILAFGNRHYRYASGREGDTAAVGFAARAANLVLYLTVPLDYADDLFERLGRHRLGKGCVYLRRLDDVDERVLRELIARSYERAGATSSREAE